MIPIPFGTDRPQRRFPWMNVALIAANVIIYFLSHSFAQRLAHGPGMPPPASDELLPAWRHYMLFPIAPHLYQFLTYQFLHAGLSHIGFNMLFLYVFGNNLNEKLGHISYLLFYLAGGVLAGCGHMLVSNGPVLGASGAISAVTGLFLVLLPRIHIRVFIWLYIYMDVWEIPSMFFILIKMGEDIFELLTGSGGVAYMAHISGALAGFLIGVLLLLTKLVQRDHYDLLAMLARFRRRQVYRSVVAGGYDPYQNRPAPPAGTLTRGQAHPNGAKVNHLSNTDPRIDSLRSEIGRLLRVHQGSEAAARYLELLAVDPTQVLPAQEQVDVASQLMANGEYAAAAAAYEGYLALYPAGGVGQQDQITLMLGVIYARYLSNAPRAAELLQKVLPKLHNAQEQEMAVAELQALGLSPPPDLEAPPPGSPPASPGT
jgi:membrane associated rhomboid family serine protease